MFKNIKAPEFPAELQWFNSGPFAMAGLKGKAVLIDFWTYSCINCLRTLPHLKRWHELYSDKGLVIIGVHAPEFEFEKNPSNVRRALKEFDIKYSVVLDSDYLIWSLYSNNAWPRKFLINKEGRIIYDHSGEGNYEETEVAIQKALLELNPDVKLPVVEKAAGAGGVCYPATPEIYLGSLRGRFGKIWNFEGDWKIFPEFIEHQGKGKEFTDFILLNFESFEVNLVAGTKDGQPAELKLELDGQPYGSLKIQDYKMYNLFKAAEFRRGQLKISCNFDGLRAFAFTFKGCKE
ncbi:MAG: redoxin domain-containing protein [Candidatus Brennerbacteria bacterium]|nr:redoxin domain-containing protein [Candidatus Brennerbacteria bacterium]